MATCIRSIVLGLALVLILPGLANAGMPSPTLADVRRVLTLSNLTRERLEVISFFLLGLLACAGVIQWVWNSLRKDFAVLPRLSYGRACGVIVLWGLLFVLVLTMVSGARELMTPGAWEKRGLTYRLVQDQPPPVEQWISDRYRALDRLREALWAYAQSHDDHFPPPEMIPETTWRVPGTAGKRYVYRGGLKVDREFRYPGVPLAYEPDAVGPDRLVLLTDREIIWLPADAVEGASGREER